MLSCLQLMDSLNPTHLAFHINGSCLTGEWLTVFCFWTGKLAIKSCKHIVRYLAVLCREIPYFMIHAWPHSTKKSHWCYSVFQVSLELHLSVLSRCLTSPLTMLYIPLKSGHRSLWRKTRGISMVYICKWYRNLLCRAHLLFGQGFGFMILTRLDAGSFKNPPFGLSHQ